MPTSDFPFALEGPPCRHDRARLEKPAGTVGRRGAMPERACAGRAVAREAGSGIHEWPHVPAFQTTARWRSPRSSAWRRRASD
eukprot:7703757-Pyramimonas_sp.AAC.1